MQRIPSPYDHHDDDWGEQTQGRGRLMLLLLGLVFAAALGCYLWLKPTLGPARGLTLEALADRLSHLESELAELRARLDAAAVDPR